MKSTIPAVNPESPHYTAFRLFAAFPLALSLLGMVLCGGGFLWSMFFDTPGHAVAALMMIPIMMASLLLAIVMRVVLRQEASYRKLTGWGMVSNVLVLLICVGILSFLTR